MPSSSPDDGAAIYLSYHGYLEMNEAVQTALAAGRRAPTRATSTSATAPRLETGDERYAWVNHTLFVSEGRRPARGRVPWSTASPAVEATTCASASSEED